MIKTHLTFMSFNSPPEPINSFPRPDDVFVQICKSLPIHYSNILKNLPAKNKYFQIKNFDIFHISAQYINCEYSLEPPQRGGSNGYPQSMFLSRNKIK